MSGTPALSPQSHLLSKDLLVLCGSGILIVLGGAELIMGSLVANIVDNEITGAWWVGLICMGTGGVGFFKITHVSAV